jgi:hypothetical protein
MRKVKGKTRRTSFESDWESYYSSHEGIKSQAKLTPERYEREILHLCRTRGETNWKEVEEIIKRDALWSEEYLNDNLLGKYFRKNVAKYYSHEYSFLSVGGSSAPYSSSLVSPMI